MFDQDNEDAEYYMELDLESMDSDELKELSYFLWACFPENDELMRWRHDILIPHIEEQESEDEGTDDYDE